LFSPFSIPLDSAPQFKCLGKLKLCSLISGSRSFCQLLHVKIADAICHGYSHVVIWGIARYVAQQQERATAKPKFTDVLGLRLAFEHPSHCGPS
jgi:hypothetical protein